MRSVFSFVVEPKDGRYNNVKDVNGKELILNTEIQNYQYVNRVGIVKEVPLFGDTFIKQGDEIIVHHNVFRKFHDIHGEDKNSRSHYDENTYFVDIDQIFLYKQNGKWKATDGYCFIKPLKNKDIFIDGPEIPAMGIIKYTDSIIGNKGIEPGSFVGFIQGAEYEFIIEGQRLYRVPTNLISVKYERKGDEEEYNPSWA
jgi:hypothetical protein